MNTEHLLGVTISNLTADELNQQVIELVAKGGSHIVSHVNIHAMNIAYENEWYRRFLNAAAVNFCDGDGVRLIGQLAGADIKEKITYNRWIWDLAELSQANGFSWYMLGATQKSVRAAHQRLIKRYPKLNIKGFRNGYIRSETEKASIIEDINQAEPTILMVGMGMPRQEHFLLNAGKELNYRLAFTAGAVFDYVSGQASMTPNFMYRLKLEWLYRLLHEPSRLARRYLRGNPVFLWRVIKHHIIRNN